MGAAAVDAAAAEGTEDTAEATTIGVTAIAGETVTEGGLAVAVEDIEVVGEEGHGLVVEVVIREVGVEGIREAGVEVIRKAGVEVEGIRKAGVEVEGTREAGVEVEGIREAGVEVEGIREAGVEVEGIREAGVVVLVGGTEDLEEIPTGIPREKI